MLMFLLNFKPHDVFMILPAKARTKKMAKVCSVRLLAFTKVLITIDMVLFSFWTGKKRDLSVNIPEGQDKKEWQKSVLCDFSRSPLVLITYDMALLCCRVEKKGFSQPTFPRASV
ncbi:hypothetical protein CEXT_520151 [Caerostris extrusa]|uniref:Uncharacterized protein n=1 Tax=Caerostris extrusa TaxID=172846 RepID=A0AAV4N4T9_CAEEX|nr:hypothetical protein CEXT_520151 [Caerostris extrusa]